MKTIIRSLLLLLFATASNAQEVVVKPEDLPPHLFGDYNNASGSWSMDFEKDYIYENHYLPHGYYDKIVKENDVYTFFIKPVKGGASYNFKLKISNDTIWIAPTSYMNKYMPYTHVPESDIKYPDKKEFIKKYLGKWYLADGSNKLGAEFFEDYCLLDGEKYAYNRLINFQNGKTLQMNVRGPKFGRYIHFWGEGNYTGLNVLSKANIGLKRDPILPDKKSISYDEIPEKLKCKWFSTNGNGLSLEILPTYELALNAEKIKISRLAKSRDKVTVEISRNGEMEIFTLEPHSDGYCKLIGENRELSYLKNNKKLPDGIVSENKFQGDWFSGDGDKATMLITANSIMLPAQKPEKFSSLVFDGNAYKFFNKKKKVASICKVNDEYLELLNDGNKALYRAEINLPAAASLKKPDQFLLKNWFNTINGKWELGFTPKHIIYQSSFWQYDQINYLNGIYTINASKTDTVCYHDASGTEVCKLVEKNKRFSFEKMADGQLKAVSGSETGIYSSSPGKLTYASNANLPLNIKAGTAVVTGYVSNMPSNLKNSTFKVIVNDWIYGKQVSYSTKVAEDGRFTLKVPMAGTQDVYFEAKNSFSTNFLIPGDTLVIAVNGEKLGDPSAFYFMGQSADINKDMMALLKSKPYEEFTRKLYEEDRTNLALEPEAYKAARKKMQSQQIEFFNEKAKTYSFSPAFKEWYKLDQELRYYDDLFRYRWLAQENQAKVKKAASYFNFIDSINLVKSENKVSGHFENLINSLYMHYSYYSADKNAREINGMEVQKQFWKRVLAEDKKLTIKEKETIISILNRKKGASKMDSLWTEVYKANADLISAEVGKAKKAPTSLEILELINKSNPASLKNQYTAFKSHLAASKMQEEITARINLRNKELSNFLFTQAYLKQQLSRFDTLKDATFMKQLVLGKQFYQSIESQNEEATKSHWDGLVQAQMDKDAMAHLEKPYLKFKEELSKPLPKYASLTQAPEGSADEWLKNIATKHAGKLIYIDVWAPWCGPCRDELEKSPAMKEASKGKDVVYVYFCGSGEKKAWENCIKKYDVQGDHYYVNRETYEDFCSKFGINGIPHYLLLNTEGQVVNKNAPRPSQVSTLLKEFDKHLMK